MLERVTNLVDLVFLLQEKHLIFVAQHDCQPFPPSMKSSDFGVLTLFVILDNFVDLFGILEYLRSQDGVIGVDNCYKVNCFSPTATGKKHLILLPQHDCQLLPPSLKSSAFCVLMLFVLLGNFWYI